MTIKEAVAMFENAESDALVVVDNAQRPACDRVADGAVCAAPVQRRTRPPPPGVVWRIRPAHATPAKPRPGLTAASPQSRVRQTGGQTWKSVFSTSFRHWTGGRMRMRSGKLLPLSMRRRHGAWTSCGWRNCISTRRARCLSAPLCIASAIAARTEANPNRHRRAGAAPRQSVTNRRGGRHGGSDQPRPADFRCGTKRCCQDL